MKVSILKITQQIMSASSSLSSKERPFIVALDGLSGAGKTIMAEQIMKNLESLNCSSLIIHIDDYIETREKRYDTGRKEWEEYYYLQWDAEKLAEDLFTPLHGGEQLIKLNFYDASADSYKRQALIVSANQIILVEGIFLQRKEWKHYFDFTVFLDCPKELRYQRVLERDSYIGSSQARLDKYKKRYWPAEIHYLKAEKPMDNADLVYRA